MTFTVVHPTDLSTDQQGPFAYAVALSTKVGARLVALHANRRGEPGGGNVSPAPLLRLWDDPSELQFEFLKYQECVDPIDTALGAINQRRADLLVVGTHQGQGIERDSHASFPETVALRTDIPTMFVPVDGQKSVDVETGQIRLDHIMVLVDRRPEPVIEMVTNLLESCQIERVNIDLLYIDHDKQVALEREGWGVRHLRRSGDIHEAIVRHCLDNKLDLVAMGTEAHQKVFEFIRGARSRHPMRKSACPLLSIPA